MFVKRFWLFQIFSSVAENQLIVSALSALVKFVLNLYALICYSVQTQ